MWSLVDRLYGIKFNEAINQKFGDPKKSPERVVDDPRVKKVLAYYTFECSLVQVLIDGLRWEHEHWGGKKGEWAYS